MAINQIMINSTIRKTQIVDNGKHWLIKGIPVTVDNAEMNGINYAAEENAKGLPTINQRPVTGGHPIKDGYPISVNEDLTEWYVGANITKHYNVKGVNYVDVKASKSLMRNSDNALGAYFADKLEAKESFGVSTGLTLTPVTNADGKIIATNQNYDHLAFLHDNEAPAGGADTMVRFNADSGVMVINIDELVNNDDGKGDKISMNSIVKKVMQVLGINSETGFDQRRELIRAKLSKGSPDADRWMWTTDIFNEYFIYEEKGNLLKQTYIIKDDQINFVGEPEIVVKEVEYKRVDPSFGNNNKSGYNTEVQTTNHEGELMSDNTELLQAINALQTSLTAQGEQLTSVVQQNADLKANMDKMKADKDAEEKAKLEKEAAEKKTFGNKLGLDDAEVAEMSINTLRKLAGEVAPITANAVGGFHTNAANDEVF